MKNYWGYRISTENIDYFQSQLSNGILRQGWGYNEGQDLRNNPLKFDEGANRNKRMLQVKKGDYLLVPQLPEWGKVTIVEATEDWDIGYSFEIDKNIGDFGHKFPARIVKIFVRNNENISRNIKSTLKNVQRFWNINYCAEDIEKLINSNDSFLEGQSYEDRFLGVIKKSFKHIFEENKFKNDVCDRLSQHFCNEEWEFALVEGLQSIYPFYNIERIGGKEEVNHGTDILIRIPSIIKGYEYGVAIQVKDYIGEVRNEVIDQINKAETYFQDKNELKLIEKIVIVTNAKQEENFNFIKYAKEKDVKVIFSEELKEILFEISKKTIGLDE